MVFSTQPLVTRQSLRQAMLHVLLADPTLAPDLRRNFDGTHSLRAKRRADQLADATLELLLGRETGIFFDHLKTRVSDCDFKPALELRFQSCKGTQHFGTAQPNSQAVTSMVDGISNLLADLKVRADGEIVNVPATDTAQSKPAKFPKPKATLTGDADLPAPVDVQTLRETIRNFFAANNAVLAGHMGGRNVFGPKLDKRVNGLTDAALLALAPKAGGTLAGWKSTVTKMAQPESTLALRLHHEIKNNRSVYPSGFYSSAIQNYDVNDTPSQLAQQLSSHLQQWMTVEKIDAAAVDPAAPKSAKLAEKVDGKDKGGRAA